MMLSVSAYAKHLGVCTNTIYRMIWDGTLPAMKVRGRYRIDPDKADAFLDVQEENAERAERRHAGQEITEVVNTIGLKEVNKIRQRRMLDEIRNGTYGRGYSMPWMASNR